LAGILKDETTPINSSGDIVKVRQLVRECSVSLGFSLVEQTKMVTAASELARNVLEHGGGGHVRIETLQNERRKGIKLTFIDEGPGIPNIEQALKDGFSTGSGMGLGLGGAKRLTNDFEIESTPGRGTKVAITRWRSN
jgi:serine/threonine-protein kinase RsbT